VSFRRFGELPGRRDVYDGSEAGRLLEDMLVFGDALDTDINFCLYGGHIVARNLRWNIVAGISARCRMDVTLYRYPPNTAVDADYDAEESEIAPVVHAGT